MGEARDPRHALHLEHTEVRRHKVRKQIQRGGAWRQFVRSKSLGLKGKPDFKELRLQYEQHGQICAEAGEAGALARKQAKQGQTTAMSAGSFGPTTRQNQAIRRRAEMQAFRRETSHMSPWARAVELLGRHRRGESQKRCVWLAKGWKRLANAEKQSKRKLETEALERYDEVLGRPKLQSLQQSLPVLKRSSYRVVPHPTLTAVELLPDGLKSKATRLCAWATGNPESSLSAGLDKVWTQLHESGTKSSHPTETVAAEEAKQPCLEAGVCICANSPDGVTRKRVRNLFLRLCKAQFNTPIKKGWLQDGHVCVRFRHDGPTPDEAGRTVLLQVALQYWSPYRPTFHMLTECVASEELASPDLWHAQVGSRGFDPTSYRV